MFIALLQNNDMDNLDKIDLVYCFQTETFNKALGDWQAEQMAAYPNNDTARTNIQVATQAMRDFMTSHHVINHSMVVEQLIQPENKTDKPLGVIHKNRG